MFASTILFSALASMAIAVPVAPVARDGAPAGWAYGYLENYNTYHTRYLALDCQDKHDTKFFDQCCHPLLATQTLQADRPPQCDPSNAQISSAEAESATATAANDDAAAQFEAATSTVSSAQAAATTAAASTAAASTAAPAASSAASSNDNTNQDNTSSNNNNSGGNVNTGGMATFFYQNGNPGACGNYNSDSTPLVAIDIAWWPSAGSTPSPYCGQWVQITNTQNGKTVNAQVEDVCPTCVNANSLDLSTGAFNQIADESQGTVPISWKFI